jgi:hypothetical protein
MFKDPPGIFLSTEQKIYIPVVQKKITFFT